ncbi:MAG: NAD(P)H-quinone oxidoreductase [Deltaproteobacteria bacterium]|nr:NAD(P)H-quinone oxidoreductase [Deltaproteobacteria bacterium]
MLAIDILKQEGHPLRWAERERPVPKTGEVVLEVVATAVNRADLLQRMGRYPPPQGVTDVMGLEASGRVVALGEGVQGVALGDEVCALLAGGGYAQYVACPESQLLPCPSSLTLVEAAALPEAIFTAYLNLYLEGELAPGEVALVHAGASGVGTAALQICRALGNGAYATASGGKLSALAALGAVASFDRAKEDFVTWIKDQTGGRGADVILDVVGGRYLERNLAALAPGGRLVVIGLLGGATGQLALGRLLQRRLRIVGSVLRGRSVEEKQAIRDAIIEQVWPHVETGAIRPVIDCVLPMAEIEQAHTLLRENRTVGKVLLEVPAS